MTKFYLWWHKNELSIKTILLSAMTSLLTNAVIVAILMLVLSRR